MSLRPASGGFWLGSLFDPEDGGNMLLYEPRVPYELHGIATRRIILFTVTTVRTLNPTKWRWSKVLTSPECWLHSSPFFWLSFTRGRHFFYWHTQYCNVVVQSMSLDFKDYYDFGLLKKLFIQRVWPWSRWCSTSLMTTAEVLLVSAIIYWFVSSMSCTL
jgi:hypothetical protein